MPINPSYPGVYVEEIPSGVRAISGVATSVAAFVDCFKRGPLNTATRILSMADFERIFGGLDPRSEASYAIQQFFLNGGSQAWVVRVAGKGEVPAQSAGLVIATEDEHTPALELDALSSGLWGNNLRVVIDAKDAAPNCFNLTVSEYTDTGSRPNVVRQEVFRNLSLDPTNTDPHSVQRVVNDPSSGSQLISATALCNSSAVPAANGSYSSGYSDPAHVSVGNLPRVSVEVVSATGAWGPNVVDVPLQAGQYELRAIAAAIQQAIRSADFRMPALSGASVDVVDHALRILPGPCDDPDASLRVTAIGQATDGLATTLQLTSATTATAILSGPIGDTVPVSWPSMQLSLASGEAAIATLNPAPDVDVTQMDLPSLAAAVQNAIQNSWYMANGSRQRMTSSAFTGAQAFVVQDTSKQSHFVIQPGGTVDVGCFEIIDVADILAGHLKLTAQGARQVHATVSAQLTLPLTLKHGSSTVTVGTVSDTVTLQTKTYADLIELASDLEHAIQQSSQAGFGATRVMVDTAGKRLVVIGTGGVTFDAAGVTATLGADLLLTPDHAQRSGWPASLSDGFDASQMPALTWPVVLVTSPGEARPAVVRLEAPEIDLTSWMPLDRVRGLLENGLRSAITTGAVPAALSGAGVSVARFGDQSRLLVTWGPLPAGVTAAPAFACNEFSNSFGTDLQLTPGTNGRACTVTLGGSLPNPLQVPATAKNVTVSIGSTTATAALMLPNAGAATCLTTIADALQTAIRASHAGETFAGAVAGVIADSASTGHLAVLPGGSTSTDKIVFVAVPAGPTPDPSGFVATSLVNAQAYTLGKRQPTPYQISATPGQDGAAPDASAIIGELSSKTGIYALEDADQFNLLCLPGVVSLADAEAQAALSIAVAYCEKRRAMLLVDVPPRPRVGSYSDALNWLTNVPRSANAAIFYPRIQMADPLDAFRPRSRGASGTVAGVFARTDAARGVWKAPAGIDAVVRNVQGLDDVLTDLENGVLNEAAVNCLRNFPIYQTVVWGARTLLGSDAEGSEWKYVSVRRTALFIEESLTRGLKWVVFEPNDEPLWAQIRLNVGAFMQNLFRQGAFQGQSPREAYFVKCDGETTTPTDVNLGRVNIVVGFAPLKPAEFVVIQLQQMAGQPAM